MPFTPTILKENFNQYIYNPKKIEARFMSMAFDTTDLGKKIFKLLFILQTLRPDLNSYQKEIILNIMK